MGGGDGGDWFDVAGGLVVAEGSNEIAGVFSRRRVVVVVRERLSGATLAFSSCALRDRDLEEDVVAVGVERKEGSACGIIWVECKAHGFLGVFFEDWRNRRRTAEHFDGLVNIHDYTWMLDRDSGLVWYAEPGCDMPTPVKTGHVYWPSARRGLKMGYPERAAGC